MSVFNMLSGPYMFPARRWNDALRDGTFGCLMSYGADPNMPLLNRRGARTVFSHFLDISLSKFLGEKCFKDYLRTLDAFYGRARALVFPLTSQAQMLRWRMGTSQGGQEAQCWHHFVPS
ncbi:hypothetical protein FALCPG4_009873 [Fusarium falciforme]